MNHQDVANLLIQCGFDSNLVESARKISEKGGTPTLEEQQILDNLKNALLLRLNSNWPHKKNT
jgi:hypothetical protein